MSFSQNVKTLTNSAPFPTDDFNSVHWCRTVPVCPRQYCVV